MSRKLGGRGHVYGFLFLLPIKLFPVARPLRIEFPGAYYHVTSRGNERKVIFRRPRPRRFLELLGRDRRAPVILQHHGVGPRTTEKLLQHFGSSNLVRNVSEDELAKVAGRTAAKRVRQYYDSPVPRS